MTPELAKINIEFLKRTQLSGAEVPALLQVMQALGAIANPPAPEPEKDA